MFGPWQAAASTFQAKELPSRELRSLPGHIMQARSRARRRDPPPWPGRLSPAAKTLSNRSNDFESMRHAIIELGYDPDRDPQEAIYAMLSRRISANDCSWLIRCGEQGRCNRGAPNPGRSSCANLTPGTRSRHGYRQFGVPDRRVRQPRLGRGAVDQRLVRCDLVLRLAQVASARDDLYHEPCAR